MVAHCIPLEQDEFRFQCNATIRRQAFEQVSWGYANYSNDTTKLEQPLKWNQSVSLLVEGSGISLMV